LGARVVLISSDQSRLRYAIRLHFLASNNAAEYEALINGLCITIKLGATRLYIRGDSELVVDQVMKESSCKSPLMAAYCQEVRKLEDKFQGIELHHVPQKDNDATDFLTKLAARWDPSPEGIFINDLHEPSTHILEGPTKTCSDTNPTTGVSNLGASMTTSPADVAMVVLDQTD
jgi:ribonuclease HI